MEQKDAIRFFSGTSGLILPVRNKQFFPAEFQEKTRLAYYASLFNSIEINSSFYKVPMASTVKKWTGEVPENFKFTFKLWRDITHVKGLAFNPADVDRFLQIIDQAGDKKGSLLVQFPPSLKVNMAAQFEQLLITIAEADSVKSWKVAVEFRHSSWYHEEIFEMIRQFGFGIVLHDKPGSATPLREFGTDFVYLRFHGPNGDYRGHYDQGFLQEYAQMISDWLANGATVFAYFNNTMGEAIDNLNTLSSLISHYEYHEIFSQEAKHRIF